MSNKANTNFMNAIKTTNSNTNFLKSIGLPKLTNENHLCPFDINKSNVHLRNLNTIDKIKKDEANEKGRKRMGNR